MCSLCAICTRCICTACVLYVVLKPLSQVLNRERATCTACVLYVQRLCQVQMYTTSLCVCARGLCNMQYVTQAPARMRASTAYVMTCTRGDVCACWQLLCFVCRCRCIVGFCGSLPVGLSASLTHCLTHCLSVCPCLSVSSCSSSTRRKTPGSPRW